MDYSAHYHTGIDISVFIGPLWVEEAVSIYLRTATNDIVVYPYSDPHYSRSLVGRYIMQGSLTVNVTEPDYLLRLIETARAESITESALRELIAKRTNLFQQTLSSRLISLLREKGSITFGGRETTEEMVMKYAVDYTERVTREVELMSVRYLDSGKRIIDPRTFELTIISGRPGSTTESIEIFQDVKVVGTERVSENNDQTQTVTYSIIARRKPPLVVKTPQYVTKECSFVTENILEIAEAYARHLCQEILSTCSLDCFSTAERTAYLLNNPNVGYIGDLSPKSRFYGTTATFVELVWQLSLPPLYVTEKPKDIPKVSLFVEGKETETDAVFFPPREDGKTNAFTNAYGRIASIEKDDSLRGLSAAAAVAITPLTENEGYGTLYSPRKKLTGSGIASLIPPQLVDPQVFGYTEDLIPDLTASTLWSNPFNVRACAGDVDPDAMTDRAELNEIVQPAYTFGVISNVTVEKDRIVLSYPVPIDYLFLERKDYDTALVAPSPLPESKSAYTVAIADGGVTTDHPKVSPMLKIGHAYAVSSVSLDDIPSAQELVNQSGPKYGLVTIDMLTAAETSGFGRCVFLRPFVCYLYLNPSTVQAAMTCTGGNHSIDHPIKGVRIPETIGEFCSIASTYTDVTCGVDLDYDFVIRRNDGGWFCLDGAFFGVRTQDFPTEVKCPTCQQTVTYTELGIPAKLVVLWLLVTLPVDTYQASKQPQKNDVTVVHDTTMKRARIAEFYNIVRCDSRVYDITAMKTNGEMIVENFTGIVDEVVTSLEIMFGNLVNVNRTIEGFVYPIKGSMRRIATQFSHYTIAVSVAECVRQLGNVTLPRQALGDTVPTAVAKKDTITLRDALTASVDRAGKSFVGKEVADEKLATMFRRVLTETLSTGPYDVIVENEKTRTVSIRRYTLPTLPSLVCFGLTDQGYEYLTKTSAPEQELILPNYTEMSGA